jgi:hypothetical protein
MKSIVLITLICSIICLSSNKKENPSAYCTITSDKTIYKIGEVPRFEVRIYNNTKKNIILLGSLDGSEQKLRMPWCYFEIEKPKADTIVFQSCKTSNPLRTEDFVQVKRNEPFNPFMKKDEYGFFPNHSIAQPETFRNPGLYKIRFYYSTVSKDISNYISNSGTWVKNMDSLQLKALFKKMTHLELVSNTIELRIL